MTGQTLREHIREASERDWLKRKATADHRIKLLGITGKARSGKDTAADFLVANGWVRYRFADPLKAAIRVMFGLTEVHTDGVYKERPIPWLGVSPRQLMQTLGTEWGREMIRDDIWLRVADKILIDVEDQGAIGVVIPDVRFPNEAAWIRNHGGTVVELKRTAAEQVHAHVSEAGIDEPDHSYVNDASRDKLRQYITTLAQTMEPRSRHGD